MERYKFITKEQLIASYLSKFKVNKVSVDEMYRWAKCISSVLSKKQVEAIVLYLEANRDVIKSESQDLFVKLGDSYYMQNGVDEEVLDEKIFKYMHVDLFFNIVDINNFVPKDFAKSTTL